MEALVMVIGLIVLNIAAWHWGVDSTEGVTSREWERRRDWRTAGRN